MASVRAAVLCCCCAAAAGGLLLRAGTPEERLAGARPRTPVEQRFNGTQGWHDFRSIISEFSLLAHDPIRELMEAAEARALANGQLDSDRQRELSTWLYQVLRASTEGKARALVEAAGQSEGLLAWKALCETYGAEAEAQAARPEQFQLARDGTGQQAPAPTTTKVVVVVRTYLPQLPQVPALVGNLSSQAVEGCERECVSFLLLPTEAASLEPCQRLSAELRAQGFDVTVPPRLSQRLFAVAEEAMPRCDSSYNTSTTMAEDICEAFKEVEPQCLPIISKYPTEGKLAVLDKLCGAANSVHFFMTDRAIDYAVQRFRNKKAWLLITNGDNAYHPRFLAKTTARTHTPMVATFWEENANQAAFRTKFKLGKVDLGAAIVDLRRIESTGARFLSSLPKLPDTHHNVPRMRALHDLDFWFFHGLMTKHHFTKTVVKQNLFTHY